MDDEDCVECEGDIVAETDKAWLVEFDGGLQEWLPKSQCDYDGDGVFFVPTWLARKKGLE